MKTISRLISAIVIFMMLFLINNCSVGTLVNVKAVDINYPVSHSNNFYSIKDSLIKPGQYKIKKEFSFTVTKWGVASIIDIERDEDISKELNNIIKDSNGDAIIDLVISVSNPAINGFSLFVKTISFWTALAGTALTITEPSAANAIIAASSAIVYIFTPAAADINFEGKVVKLLN